MILLSNSKLLGLVIVCPWTTFQTTAKEYANLPSRLPLVLHVVHAPFVKLLRPLVSGLVLIRGKWSTTRENLESRTKTGFYINILPATFRDAVTVTRKLGIRYLWIDSLCICQGDEQGDKDDWASEAEKMQDVFRGAYCTIAATSAQDSTKGFLARPALEPGKWVCTTQPGDPSTFTTTFMDNFQVDVLGGILNTRAWVLQERALSRRTLHFTDRQTYWECGGGVRCETLTYMRNYGSILSDPEFPRSLEDASTLKQFEIPHKLIARYSGLGLTNKTDRGTAIRSLITAMAKTLNTPVDFGVFHKFTHRSLLWRRNQEVPMVQIQYPEQATPPSWSWESYKGKIDYLVWEPGPEWDTSVKLDTAKLTARIKRLQVHERKTTNLHQILRDYNGSRIGDLWFDGEIRDLKEVCQTLSSIRYGSHQVLENSAS
ncbi:heterokaryon incompatibility protein-domain-containing protein [Diaporthe sp. PMI_573]|nr:heterokaryon incompatibility protein-domain-containing protein [Diaporthaceae sp. PMI_573]